MTASRGAGRPRKALEMDALVWVVLSGAITLLLSHVSLAHWPVSSLYILGLFRGIDLIFAGVSWISVGSRLKTRP